MRCRAKVESQEGGRKDEGRQEKGLRLSPSSPAQAEPASFNQCVIAISRKVQFALNRAERKKKRKKQAVQSAKFM